MSDPNQPQDPNAGTAPEPAPTAGTIAPEGAAAPADTPATAKADLVKRFLALLIDAFVAGVLSRLFALVGLVWLGGIVAGLYMLFRDGFDLDFMDHRSLGKRLMRLRPLCDDGSPVTLRVSARRNWTLSVSSLALILVLIPILGWLLIPLVWIAGVVLALIEAYLTYSDPEGRRWGDRFAGTRVVETDA